MKIAQTESGNFVLVSEDNGMPISRPYLNHCDLGRRKEKQQDYSNLNLQKTYEEKYKEGMFEGYDRGHDLGINDLFAKEILNSNILLN